MKKQRKININITVSLVIIAVIMLWFFVFRPAFIGFVVREQFFTHTDVLNESFAENESLIWSPEYAGKITRVGLSGSFTGLGTARVYLKKENESYVVFDSDEFDRIDYLFEVENRSEENATIDVILNYKKGTSWDRNDDGFETIKGVVDLTVEDTEFEFDVNESNLCTRWEVYSVDNETSSFVCYGSAACCEFVGLVPTLEKWDETFNSFFGRLSASYRNIIRAQIVYVGEEIGKSNWKALKAVFMPEISFSDVCVETCSLELNYTSYDLVVEVENASLVLTNISYTVKSVVENRAPELIKLIPNVSVKKDEEVSLNLSNYFYDGDNDTLNYSLELQKKFSYDVVENILTITPEKNFVGNLSLVIKASDGYDSVSSNDFNLNIYVVPDVVVEILETINLPASVDDNVKFVRSINVTNNEMKGNIWVETVLPGEAENISVFDTFNNEFLDDNDVKINVEEGNISNEVRFKIKLDIGESRLFRVYYDMPAVEAVEEFVNIYTKRVFVYSDFNYSDISVETDVPVKGPSKNIRVYWLRDDGFELFEDVSYIDSDNDQLVDKVKWVVPHFSNQTFEIRVRIIDIEYSTVINRKWEIAFSTLIEGNLSVKAINGTTLAEEIIDNTSTKDDVRLDTLQCGNKIIFDGTHTESGLYFTSGQVKVPGYNVFGNSLDIDGIFVDGYYCNGVGYLTSTLLNVSKQYLEFELYGQKRRVETKEFVEGIDCSSAGCLYVKDDCGCNRAIFNGKGSVFIYGGLRLFSEPDENDFVIEDRNGNAKMWVDDESGDLYLYGGLLEDMGILSPSGNDDFIIQNAERDVTAYLDGSSGNLYLKGHLNENYFEECTC